MIAGTRRSSSKEIDVPKDSSIKDKSEADGKATSTSGMVASEDSPVVATVPDKKVAEDSPKPTVAANDAVALVTPLWRQPAIAIPALVTTAIFGILYSSTQLPNLALFLISSLSAGACYGAVKVGEYFVNLANDVQEIVHNLKQVTQTEPDGDDEEKHSLVVRINKIAQDFQEVAANVKQATQKAAENPEESGKESLMAKVDSLVSDAKDVVDNIKKATKVIKSKKPGRKSSKSALDVEEEVSDEDIDASIMAKANQIVADGERLMSVLSDQAEEIVDAVKRSGVQLHLNLAPAAPAEIADEEKASAISAQAKQKKRGKRK